MTTTEDRINANEERMVVSLEELKNWLSPSEAGHALGASGQWIKELVRRGDLVGVETHLGWLISPDSVEYLFNERLREAESRIAEMKAASAKVARSKKDSERVKKAAAKLERAQMQAAKAGSLKTRGRAAHARSLHTKTRNSSPTD